MKSQIKKYLSDIGRRGGQKSRCTITPEQQAKMQKARAESKARKSNIKKK